MPNARTRVALDRQWAHPGVRALLRRYGPDADAYEVIRQGAREIASDAVELNWGGPPFCLETLASLRGHRIVEFDGAPRSEEAFRIPGIIYVSKSWPATRRRYSIAHELVHDLVPDGDGEITEHELPPDLADRAHAELERLCQVGAAELVMPYGPFVREMRKRARGSLAVMELAELFEVSPEAAARRIVDLCDEPTAMVLARPVGALDETDLQRLAPVSKTSILRADDLIVTKTCVSRPIAPLRVFSGHAVPRRSVIRRAWGWASQMPRDSSRVHSRVEEWNEGERTVRVHVEAIALPPARVPIEVLALIFWPQTA